MNELSIAGVELTTDEEGRFNLNTLHKMSGLGSEKEPNRWLRQEGAKALCAEIEQTPDLAVAPINVIKGGPIPGTFAVEQIAVAYANWISPAFYLKVINVFLASNNKVETTPLPILPATVAKDTFFSLLEVARAVGVPESFAIFEAGELAGQQSGIDLTALLAHAPAMDDVPDQDVMLEPTELGALFGLSGAEMNNKLSELGLQSKVACKWKPTVAGEAVCARHQWKSPVSGKSGYNLKWKAAEIEAMMDG